MLLGMLGVVGRSGQNWHLVHKRTDSYRATPEVTGVYRFCRPSRHRKIDDKRERSQPNSVRFGCESTSLEQRDTGVRRRGWRFEKMLVIARHMRLRRTICGWEGR